MSRRVRGGTSWVSVGKRRSKYGNKRVVINGRKFDSLKEASRGQELELLERTGHIRDLQFQVSLPCVVDGVKVCSYVADFVYVDARTNKRVVEDAKGMKTPIYRIKKKLVFALMGIEIQEV